MCAGLNELLDFVYMRGTTSKKRIAIEHATTQNIACYDFVNKLLNVYDPCGKRFAA